MIFKKTCISLLCGAIILASSVPVFATEVPDVESGENIVGDIGISFSEGTYSEISPENIDENIDISQLPSFETREEADIYFKQFEESFVSEINEPVAINPYSRATNGTVTVGQIGQKGSPFKVYLKLNYTTSLDGNRGKITYAEAFTTLSGFTLGTTWEEKSISQTITSSGKDVYCKASGDIVSYLIINGGIEIYRSSYTVSGTAFVIR